MASLQGPYVIVQERDTFRNRTFWYVADKYGIYVDEFLNSKEEAIEFETADAATTVATNLSTDDGAYLALRGTFLKGGAHIPSATNAQALVVLAQAVTALQAANLAVPTVNQAAISAILLLVQEAIILVNSN